MKQIKRCSYNVMAINCNNQFCLYLIMLSVCKGYLLGWIYLGGIERGLQLKLAWHKLTRLGLITKVYPFQSVLTLPEKKKKKKWGAHGGNYMMASWKTERSR